VKLHRYVVFADRLRGFDALEEAKRFAQVNVPSVICERRQTPDGGTVLVEILGLPSHPMGLAPHRLV